MNWIFHFYRLLTCSFWAYWYAWRDRERFSNQYCTAVCPELPRMPPHTWLEMREELTASVRSSNGFYTWSNAFSAWRENCHFLSSGWYVLCWFSQCPKRFLPLWWSSRVLFSHQTLRLIFRTSSALCPSCCPAHLSLWIPGCWRSIETNFSVALRWFPFVLVEGADNSGSSPLVQILGRNFRKLVETDNLIQLVFFLEDWNARIEWCDRVSFRWIEQFRVCAQVAGQKALIVAVAGKVEMVNDVSFYFDVLNAR